MRGTGKGAKDIANPEHNRGGVLHVLRDSHAPPVMGDPDDTLPALRVPVSRRGHRGLLDVLGGGL